MLKYIYIILLIFAGPLITLGQSKTKVAMNCGTHTTDADITRLLANKKWSNLNLKTRENTTYLPIQFHLVATSSGGGRISPSQVFRGLCKLNEDFEGTGIQFYFNGELKHIDNTALYEMQYPPIPQSVTTLFALRRVEGTINIFIGNGLTSGNSGFYSGFSDVIYMDKRYVNSTDVILAHELGHFLSLPHTFFGWESTEYNIHEPTPTEVFRGNTSYQVEYVDREKNCEESGDFFCGTPADYITNWSGGCDYTGGAIDPDSVMIDPDETNFMSYYSFSGCEKFTFSEDQRAAMTADFESRVELWGTEIGLQNPVENTTNLVSPLQDGELAIDNILLEWETVENATLYMVEVSRIPTLFALDAQIITRDLFVEIEDLDPDKKYYWRVLAFNETNVCERPVSETRLFKTTDQSSSVSENEEQHKISVFPNPNFENNTVSIMSSEYLADCKVSVLNAAGSKVRQFDTTISIGTNELHQLDGLKKGVYILMLEKEEVSDKIKFIIH